MLDSIIRFSVKNKLVIGILTLLLIIWGIYSLAQLPVDAVPDITNNQVQIITNAPSLASQEVEQSVTYPIEQSMANLPDIEEIRSISRFGLSVVTVVFHDKVDIYFARQLINERLQTAAAHIPEGAGKPVLSPVSTGLGEVYQYIIRPRKGAEKKYSAMDLRSMQDWIVARQLYGTPGVAEINSFGGALKQYEVAVDPTRLKAMEVTIAQLVTALERNNQNTGGAYIDKKPHAYFIRGIGLVSSLEDIGNIVIKTSAGIPVLVKDVATPRFGHATRYGAVTRDGEEEVVGGIVMMLKGSNSAEVVKQVKQKMETIRSALPADVVIEPFLDRTDLVDRAIHTVEKNLVEGALIVIFVLVLFLGNLRAGLIVASAIPLSMLFALGLMHVFGVSANLMSLGAIDFGLIVDGAVIIVEATLHHLGLRKSLARLSRDEMDEEVIRSASRIRGSAAFGEIIILIVYIPVLTLTGIEGKMFRPMAQTVSFAIIGALLLSLTYIPMMCALLLRGNRPSRPGVADRMMDFFRGIYTPLLAKAIRLKYLILTGTFLLAGAAVMLFSRLGGEFLPQLQEGDFAFHCILPQGSSLSQSIETSMQAARILKTFPEVKAVIGKTGSAEVPTDPMPPEASDLVILLKDKKYWTTAKDYQGLAQKMLEKLEAIPGVFFEANQPIQMRFNELMTGVRQDVAVKIFGENLDTLAALSPRVAGIIASIRGAGTPQPEQTTGLPQITVTCDRARLAAYGLDVATVNDVLSTAFAGKSAGVIFENERRYDLVVRLDSTHRASPGDVSGLFIPLPGGSQVPLSQVANVAFREGPAQISREHAQRRVVIGFNVSGRDVQSVVRELQQKLAVGLSMPPGYYLTYGGTFENLEKASARLRIAVPVALLLIFLLLFATFRSLRQALLVFTAIPLSAIGGVCALWLRGMPFSISAGVGFIALFGVAVLNGIVLIGTFNQLAAEGMHDARRRVLEGTGIRLRPVLMTAMVASLGFLPMAIATGAGAEVQKPLATVVIGGLLTATALTLFVLPLLYLMLGASGQKSSRPFMKGGLLLATLLAAPSLFAQENKATQRLSFTEVFAVAAQNSLLLQGSDIAVQRSLALLPTGSILPRTGIFTENEDLRPSDNRGILKIGLSQNIEWPGVYKARRNVLHQQWRAAVSDRRLKELELKRSLQSEYYTLWYLEQKQALYRQLDSICRGLADIAVLRVRQGESAGLDSIAAKARQYEMTIQVSMLDKDIQARQVTLRNMMHTTENILPEARPLEKVPLPEAGAPGTHPYLQGQQQSVMLADAELRLSRQNLMPEFSGRFFSQRLYGLSDPYSGFSVSVGLPLWSIGGHKGRIRAAVLEKAYRQSQVQLEEERFAAETQASLLHIDKEAELLEYYEKQGLAQASAILQASGLAYRAGEISFAEFSQFLAQVIDTKRNYLDVLQQYNQAVISHSYYQPQLQEEK